MVAQVLVGAAPEHPAWSSSAKTHNKKETREKKERKEKAKGKKKKRELSETCSVGGGIGVWGPQFKGRAEPPEVSSCEDGRKGEEASLGEQRAALIWI